jgi:molybdate-binding protein
VPRRLALAEVDRAWIAWPLSAAEPAGQLGAADALLQRRNLRGQRALVEPLREPAALKLNLLALGCDPALAVLSSQLGEQVHGPRLRWIDAPSELALDALAAGTAHVAGCHLLDEESGEFNVHAVRARFPKTDMLIVSLAKWPVGLVVAPGNPKGLRGAQDLARKGVQIINRPEGAEARRLLDRELKKAGIKPAKVRGYGRVARSHQEVAQAVALGGADAGVAPVATALAWGLSFLELSEERFDLVLPLARAADPKIGRLLDVLGSDRFERELQALPGYDPTCAGEVVAELRAQG